MSEPDRELCGVGIRGVSMLVDSFVWFALFIVGVFVVAVPTGELESTPSGADAELTGLAGLVGLVVVVVLIVGYHAVTEWRYGQTLGKHLVKIEVEDVDGGRIGPRAAVVRNVLRFVDWLPFLYLLGIVFMSTSDRHQRFGDRVADTVVVRS